MIALLVNKKEHIFDTQFIHPFVSNKLDKKAVDGQNIITLTGKNIHMKVFTQTQSVAVE